MCPKCRQKYLFELEYTDNGNPNFFARRCVGCGEAFSIVVNSECGKGYPDIIELFTPNDYRLSHPLTFPDLWVWLVKHNGPRQRYTVDYSREGNFTYAGTIGDPAWREKESFRRRGLLSGHEVAIFIVCDLDLLLQEM